MPVSSLADIRQDHADRTLWIDSPNGKLVPGRRLYEPMKLIAEVAGKRHWLVLRSIYVDDPETRAEQELVVMPEAAFEAFTWLGWCVGYRSTRMDVTVL